MSKNDDGRRSPARGAASEELSSFHKAFPSVQPTEKVVESYPCGLKKIKGKSSSVVPVVKMGRLYLTARHCCFQSPFLKVGMCVMWEDVKAVDKKSFFFYDEIHVTTTQEAEGEEPTQYCLTAFLYGATAGAFDMMHTLWSVCSKYSRLESNDPRQSRSLEGAASSSPSTTDALTAKVEVAPKESGSVSKDVPTLTLKDHPATPPQAALVVTPRTTLAPAPPQSPQDAAIVDDTGDGSDVELRPIPEPPRATTPAPSSSKDERLSTPQRRRRKHSRLLARYFASVPENETVVDEFQCAYVHGVHRVGKLYITSHYLLFYSPFLSESLVLPFADIAAVEKVTTLVLLDGIAVTMQRGSIPRAEFSSFVYRDSAFTIIQHFFSTQKGKEALGLVPQVAEGGVAQRERANTAPPGVATSAVGEVVEAVEAPFKTLTSSPNSATHGVVSTLDELLSSMETDFGTAMSPWSSFVTEVLPESTLPKGSTLTMCFRCLFDDDHVFTKSYHGGRGDTNITIEPWRPLRGEAARYGGQRTLRCTTTVKAIITGQYGFIQHQRYAFANVGGTPHLVVHFSGQVPQITYGDSFMAETLLLIRDRGHGKLTLTVMGYIQFLKSVWVKGKITSSALGTEMPQSYRRFFTLAEETLSAATASASAAHRAGAELKSKEVAPAASAEEPVVNSSISVSPISSRRVSEVEPVPSTSVARKMVSVLGLLAALFGLYRLCVTPTLESAPTLDLVVRPLLATMYCAAMVWWMDVLQRHGVPIP